jgi:hypothetical protein
LAFCLCHEFELRLRAERMAGQKLIEMRVKGERARQGGDRAKLQRATLLVDLGVEKTQSYRWQQMARHQETKKSRPDCSLNGSWV